MSKKNFSVNDIQEKINDILTEPEIRFAALIDNKGKLIVGGFRKGIAPFENDEQRKQMFLELAHRVANRESFDANLCRVKYSSSRREKVVMMSFPLSRHIILIIAETSVNIDRLGWKIMYKLDRQWSEFHGL
jgi:hypothetical protein